MAGSGVRLKERHYEPLWKQVKKDKKVSIALAPAWHKRVKKAVCKEKNMDYGYKFYLDEEKLAAELTFTSKDSVLTIVLVEQKILALENL